MDSRDSARESASRRLGRLLERLYASAMAALGLRDILSPDNEPALRRLLRFVVLLQGAVLVAVGIHELQASESLPTALPPYQFLAFLDQRRQLGEWFGWAGVILGVAYVVVCQWILWTHPRPRPPGALDPSS